MSERLWATVGKIAAVATILGALVAVLAFLIAFNAPSSRLVADIRPMAFRLPVTAGQLAELTKAVDAIDFSKSALLEVGRATGLVKPKRREG